MAVVVGLVFSLLGLLSSAQAYFVNVDAHADECFFDRVSSGMKMGLTFEVVEGGFLDIDVKITGPDDRVIYTGERESSGKYTFAAHIDGMYRYCFSNQMSSMTPKTVMFSMDLGDAPKQHEGENQNQLEKMVSDLSMGLSVMKHEQEYMEVRERLHRMKYPFLTTNIPLEGTVTNGYISYACATREDSINDNTNSRVVWWSIFESVLLIVMTMGQIYYLKRFFEVKRVI